MHELSLTRSIVSACVEHAKERRVRAVHLRVGLLSGVEPHALSFCFELCARGTVVEGAELVIEPVMGRGHCQGCDQRVDLDSPIGICPCERRERVTLVAGDELVLDAMEV